MLTWLRNKLAERKRKRQLKDIDTVIGYVDSVMCVPDDIKQRYPEEASRIQRQREETKKVLVTSQRRLKIGKLFD